MLHAGGFERHYIYDLIEKCSGFILAIIASEQKEFED